MSDSQANNSPPPLGPLDEQSQQQQQVLITRHELTSALNEMRATFLNDVKLSISELVNSSQSKHADDSLSLSASNRYRSSDSDSHEYLSGWEPPGKK